jgi:hypothetical protein
MYEVVANDQQVPVLPWLFTGVAGRSTIVLNSFVAVCWASSPDSMKMERKSVKNVFMVDVLSVVNFMFQVFLTCIASE